LTKNKYSNSLRTFNLINVALVLKFNQGAKMYKNYCFNYLFRALKTHESIISWLARFIASLMCVISSVAMAAPSDLSGEGRSDLIFRNNSTGEINAWLMNNGVATSTAQLVGPGNWSVSHTADFNGDGKADILFRNDDGSVSLWLMNGLSPISQAGLLGADANWRVSHAGDFNGDGKADILWRNSNGAVTLWLMNGTTVVSQVGLLGPDPGWSVTHVADFNGDGKADLLWQNTNGAVTIWLMNGSTTTSAVGILGPNPDWRVSHTADLNGDGKADLLWRNINGAVTAWLMNGTTTTSAAGLIGTDPYWRISNIGDFNGDGKSDILWRNTDGTARVWLMTGTSMIGSGDILGADPNLTITHVGDYNGDGKSDIVWRSASNGIVTMGLMNGAAFVSTPRILNTGVWGQTPWVVLPSSITLPPATSLASGFSDPGFTRGAIRTEYDQGVGAGNSWLTLLYANNGLPGVEGCLWDANDPINTYRVGCPGRAPLGSSDTPWYGANQFFDACRVPSSARLGDSWLSCISYIQSNQFSVNWTPNSDYWVLSANSEPSFDQCNLGPPSLSWPVNDYYSFAPSYFKAGSEVVSGTNRRRAHIVINANDFSHHCQNDPNREWIFTIPFLSVGAQQGSGQSKPIAYITNPPYARYHSTDNISFDAAMYSYQAFGCVAGTPTTICTQSNSGAHAGMYITAQWGGKNRQIFLDFFGAGSLVFPTDLSVSRLHFNWPIANSMFYPGAEIVFFNPSTLQNLCGISFPNLPINSTPSTSVLTRYQFNASEVFSCASRLGKFDSPMPLNTEIPLIGAHWYVEGVGTQGLLGVAFENMKTN
jgi:hypothetical protein